MVKYVAFILDCRIQPWFYSAILPLCEGAQIRVFKWQIMFSSKCNHPHCNHLSKKVEPNVRVHIKVSVSDYTFDSSRLCAEINVIYYSKSAAFWPTRGLIHKICLSRRRQICLRKGINFGGKLWRRLIWRLRERKLLRNWTVYSLLSHFCFDDFPTFPLPIEG